LSDVGDGSLFKRRLCLLFRRVGEMLCSGVTTLEISFSAASAVSSIYALPVLRLSRMSIVSILSFPFYLSLSVNSANRFSRRER
jgi:hypothetical protein